MAAFFRYLRSFLSPSKIVKTTPSQVFTEGDRVFLRARKDILSAPLQKNNKTNLPGTFLQHNDIIGKTAGATVRAQNGSAFRIAHPTLEQYVTLTPRKVTPIYAHDANLIVSLLDINVPTHAAWDSRTLPLEILEAGTGHGSLTLHLARAIHAANPPPPSQPLPISRRLEKDGTTVTSLPVDPSWSGYSASRHAIIHTVDASPSFSIHAEKLIHGFHHGIYAPHVNFYVSRLSEWISSHQKDKPFITHTLLDLPSVHTQLPLLVPILKEDGLATVFVPSVTQIGECVKQIKKDKLPFVLEKTLELGMGISGGRLWDVRLTSVRTRSTDRQALLNGVRQSTRDGETVAAQETSTGEDEASENDEDLSVASTFVGTEEPAGEKEVLKASNSPSEDDAQVLVCRPKVGEKIVGGGFVALFRKTA